MMENVLDLGKIILADLILSGDNALIIGIAAAGLPENLRKKALLFGMVIAALMRVFFAVIATNLLDLPGILLIGSGLLFWVCLRLYREIRHTEKGENTGEDTAEAQAMSRAKGNTLWGALFSITLADVSMSLDNVLAVAVIADGNTQMLVFGLALAIFLMAFAATLIMHLLTKFPVISWLGLFVLVYVAGEMMYRGLFDPAAGLGLTF
jgi:YjbE family integral membrane protein